METLTWLRSVQRRFGIGSFLLRYVIVPYQRLSDLHYPDQDVIVECGGNRLKVFSPRKNLIGKALYRDGIWEPVVTDCIEKKAKLGMIALDIGADIGYYSLQLSRLVGEQGRVIAFEPIPQARKHLEYNISINNCNNITVSEYALGNSEGIVYLEDPLNKSRINLNKSEQGEKDIQVSIKRMDDLMRDLHLNSIDFVKIDVEGAEHEVLLGMEQALRKYKPILVVEVHNRFLPQFGSSAEKLLGWLSSLGYQISVIDGGGDDPNSVTQTVCCQFAS